MRINETGPKLNGPKYVEPPMMETAEMTCNWRAYPRFDLKTIEGSFLSDIKYQPVLVDVSGSL